MKFSSKVEKCGLSPMRKFHPYAVAAQEKGDAPLADSLALFEEGTKLIAACSKQLDQAEQQVVKLMKGADGAPVELPFETEE